LLTDITEDIRELEEITSKLEHKSKHVSHYLDILSTKYTQQELRDKLYQYLST